MNTTEQKTSGIHHEAGEFISENGLWTSFCAYLEERGYSPQEIADAFNVAAAKSGHSAGLSPEDCQA